MPSFLKHRSARMKWTRSRALLFEDLERRELLAADWRNPVDWVDVDANRAVTPLDALKVINTINADGSRGLDTPRPADTNLPFYDVNGDGNVFPTDVLTIINAINAKNAAPLHLAKLPHDVS